MSQQSEWQVTLKEIIEKAIEKHFPAIEPSTYSAPNPIPIITRIINEPDRVKFGHIIPDLGLRYELKRKPMLTTDFADNNTIIEVNEQYYLEIFKFDAPIKPSASK